MRDGTIPKKLYKYSKYRPDFFDKLELRITPLHDFNDPFEGILSKKSYKYFLKNVQFKTEEERKETIDKFNLAWQEDGAYSRIDNVGFISFAEKDNCLIMWAHYADNHKGIIIEFDTSHDFFEGQIDDKQNPPKLLKIKSNPVEYPPDTNRPSPKVSTIEEMFINIYIFSFFKKQGVEIRKRTSDDV
ncbi:hypothetical protein ES705_12738 [subsurface metagenome]